jgi:hypothetical protein
MVEMKNTISDGDVYLQEQKQAPAHERLYRDATNRLENKFFNTMNEFDDNRLSNAHRPNIS